jgi:DNA-directed RNA polymerase specialized sigma24 family protein
MAETSFRDVDFEAVLLRLTRHAQSLFGALRAMGLEAVNVAYPGGEGPDDLAMNVLLRLLDPQDRSVRWREGWERPTTDSVYAFLRRAVTNDFFDLKKSKRYKTTVYLESEGGSSDDGEGLTLEQLHVHFDTSEGAFLKRERIKSLVAEFSDDPAAQEMFKLQLEPDGYNAFTNQELGQLLSTTVDEIENRKKRVRNRLLRIRDSRPEGERAHV